MGPVAIEVSLVRSVPKTQMPIGDWRSIRFLVIGIVLGFYPIESPIAKSSFDVRDSCIIESTFF